MSLISTFRRRQRSRSRTVLTLFVLAWLNVTLQPCVMAASGMLDTPAPQVVTNDMRHSGALNDLGASREHSDSQGACPHCALSSSGACPSGSNCTESEALQQKASAKLTKDAPFDLFAMLPGADPTFDAPQRLHAYNLDPRVDPPYASPPLNVRYCVYLK